MTTAGSTVLLTTQYLEEADAHATGALLTGTPAGDAVAKTLLWSAIILVVFCPLAIRAYARKR